MCEHCNYEEYENKLEDVIYSDENIDDSTYNFLDSVLDWIKINKHITENQKESIDNTIDRLYG